MAETGKEEVQALAAHGPAPWQIRSRVALVTGAGSGIGQAVALALGGAGLSVAVADISEERVGDTRGRLDDLGSLNVGIRGDVGDEADVGRMLDEATERLGPVDAVVHCAGIYPRSSVVDMSLTEWDRVLRTNLTSLFLLARTVLPGMIERRHGRLITFSSDLGGAGAPRGSHYAASKAGVNIFTRSVAREVAGSGVTVNAIAPGPTDTPMLRGSNTPEYIEKAAGATVQGTLGKPEDVVAPVLFLLSDGGCEISGQIVTLRS